MLAVLQKPGQGFKGASFVLSPVNKNIGKTGKPTMTIGPIGNMFLKSTR